MHRLNTRPHLLDPHQHIRLPLLDITEIRYIRVLLAVKAGIDFL